MIIKKFYVLFRQTPLSIERVVQKANFWVYTFFFLVGLLIAWTLEMSSSSSYLKYLFILFSIIAAWIVLQLNKFEWSGFKGKTFWNWLELLFVPFLLALGGIWIDNRLDEREREIAKDQVSSQKLLGYYREVKSSIKELNQEIIEIAESGSKIEGMRDIAKSKSISDLQVATNLVKDSNDISTILNDARLQVHTLLEELDRERKGKLVKYLYDLQLIQERCEVKQSGSKYYHYCLEPVISLVGSNLSNTNFSNHNLSKVKFERANLRESNLTGANLFEANLEGADLSGANLDGANLRNAKINFKTTRLDSKPLLIYKLVNPTPILDTRSFDFNKENTNKEKDLSKSNLHGVNFANTDLRNFNFKDTNLTSANLRNAQLQGADLSGVKLEAADLRGVETNPLTKLDLKWKRVLKIANGLATSMNLEGADLEGANLEGANFERVNLKKANLRGTNLKNAKLNDVDLSEASLVGVDLSKAKLHKVSLQSAKLDSANLEEAILLDTSLEGSSLIDANLTKSKIVKSNLQNAVFFAANFSSSLISEGSNLSGSDFNSTNLSKAVLEDVLLKGSFLYGANLSGADLSKAKFLRTDLNGANFTEDTIFPLRFKPTEYNMKKIETQ